MSTQRHFRFPVYDDDNGAKLKAPRKKQSIIEHDDVVVKQQQAEELLDEKIRSRLYHKNEVSSAIQDDAPPFMKKHPNEQTRTFMTTTPSAFNQQKLKEETTIETSEPLDDEEMLTELASTYQSFANDTTDNVSERYDGATPDVERIPKIKQDMQRLRETRNDSVPFHKKRQDHES